MAAEVRQNLPETRRLLAPFVVLAGLGAVVLYVFPDQTERWFSWTLAPPLSAMFMGAGFAAGVVLTVLSYRRQPWVVTRTATLTIFVFTLVMTVPTFVHLDKMHLDSDMATARFAAWIWVAVYAAVSAGLAVVIVRQMRQPGIDPVRSYPLPAPLRGSLVVQGLLLAGVGCGLFGWPTAMDGVWPWPITALAGRALSAWVLAIAFASLWVTIENDLRRTRPASITFAVLGALWLGAAVRGGAEMQWERPSAWIFIGVACSGVGLGSWGWSLARRAMADG